MIALGTERLLKKRDILIEELLLQVFGTGRNNDTCARADHRHQICQRLSRAGPRFDDQMPPLCNCLLDGLRHLQLSPTEFVSWVGARKQTSGAKELVQRRTAPWATRGGGRGGLKAGRHRVSIISDRPR